MARGGKREGAGRRSRWKHSKTKLIRVPEEFVEQVLAFAQQLDQGESVSALSAHPQPLNLLGDPPLAVQCPRCGSCELGKLGRLNSGSSRYHCPACHYQFTLEPDSPTHDSRF